MENSAASTVFRYSYLLRALLFAGPICANAQMLLLGKDTRGSAAGGSSCNCVEDFVLRESQLFGHKLQPHTGKHFLQRVVTFVMTFLLSSQRETARKSKILVTCVLTQSQCISHLEHRPGLHRESSSKSESSFKRRGQYQMYLLREATSL